MSNSKVKKSIIPKSKKVFITLGIIYFTFMAIIFISCNIGHSSNEYIENYSNYCIDYENFFTQSEIDKINDNCKKIAKKKKIAIFVSTTSRNYNLAEMNGIDFCRENQISSTETIVVVILNKNNRENSTFHFDIYTYGKADSKITNNEIDAILYSEAGDVIVSSTSGSEIVESINKVVKDCGTAFSFILPKSGWLLPCIISMIISVIVSITVVSSIKKSYSRKRENQTYSFSSNSKLELLDKSDKYIRQITTSVIISDNSSGHHGGGGHSSGGGGGGGHRGGR